MYSKDTCNTPYNAIENLKKMFMNTAKNSRKIPTRHVIFLKEKTLDFI